MNEQYFEEAIFIREVEETFLRLFCDGKINGTVHTCIGEEFSALAVCKSLQEKDFVLSNHRCHGHYLAFKKDPVGLIAELLGKKSGVCSGIGSSQHLFNENFLSNGVQGGIVPIGAGVGLAKKMEKTGGIAVVFIGDGTLGQGVLYETMNIISLWELPVLIVCENNFYAQSTAQKDNLAGAILDRAMAFNIKTYKGHTSHYESLFEIAQSAVNYVRNSSSPAFLLIETYRLRAHSKGDDYRDKNEIELYEKQDPINQFCVAQPDLYKSYLNNAKQTIEKILLDVEKDTELQLKEFVDYSKDVKQIEWGGITTNAKRYSELIYDFFREKMETQKDIVFLGEDIKYPYGGAFKVSKDLSEKFNDRTFTTPISEAAIIGIANGLALSGFRPFAEIMFGDFITLAFDQLVNHAGKFFQMYNKKVTCPIVLRTPMGGGRRYGPTHSQSLEKYLTIDGIKLLALNYLIDPKEFYNKIYDDKVHPIIVIENKTDYARKNALPLIDNYVFEKSNEVYSTIRIRPVKSKPNLTLITYGGMTGTVIDLVNVLVEELELLPEIYVITQLNPLKTDSFIDSVRNTKTIVVVEEGKRPCGIGAEILAQITEKAGCHVRCLRITSLDGPVPSVGHLEDEVIPTGSRISDSIKAEFS